MGNHGIVHLGDKSCWHDEQLTIDFQSSSEEEADSAISTNSFVRYLSSLGSFAGGRDGCDF